MSSNRPFHWVNIHGFNERHKGLYNIDRTKQPLIDLGDTVDSDSADYDWHFFFSVRFCHGDAVRRIKGALLKADAVICYSNGANYGDQALWLLPPEYDNSLIVFNVHPALGSKAPIAPAVKRQYTFFSTKDETVKWGARLRAHKWGKAGIEGYKGLDSRGMYNYDITDDAPEHGNAFVGKNAAYFANTFYQLAHQ